jgi:hypothetical protein
MKGYPSFLKKHKTAKTEAEQLVILKNYLFSLSNDDFTKFLNMAILSRMCVLFWQKVQKKINNKL